MRVVIVDDDESMRFLLRRDLGRRDPDRKRWEIATVATPDEGLRLVREADPDRPLFVLADYDLRATRTGAQVLEEVARLRPDATRVLFSGHPRAELEAAIDRAKPTAFLEKPLRLEGLIERLVHLLLDPASPAPESPATAAKALAADAAPRASAPRPDRKPDAERHGKPQRASDDRLATHPVAEDDNGRTSTAAASMLDRLGVNPYRAMVENVTDYGICMLDPEGHIVTWNPGAEHILGYSVDEAVGQHVAALYPPVDVSDFKPQYELRVAADEGRLETTAWRVRKDGTMFWADSLTTRIPGPDGKLAGFVLVTRDLTEKRHQDDALRQSEERYRLLVEGVRDYAIFMLDPTGRIASWNAGAQRIKGYSAEDIIGEHFSRFYTQPDRDRNHPQEELRLAADKGVYEEEGWRLRKDGSRFWASVVITALRGSDGELRGYAKVTRDLTQRRLHEEALRGRAAELSELARELEAFNYTVAHDLRAPLRAVIHLSEVLLHDSRSMPEEERRALLESMHTSAVRMGDLVEDLLSLSRATKDTFALQPVDVTEIARNVAAEVTNRMGAARTEVRVEEGVVVESDPRMMLIVLENLISNAVKFSQPREHPVVEVGRVETPQGMALYVRDNGVGFDEEQADRLYRPFQRLHGANEFEGTGIGLATVARIVGRHGGRLWGRSRPGEGATFYLTLGPPTSSGKGAQDPDAPASRS